MPDAVTGNLRPSPDFRRLIEAAVAAIREQMEKQLADRDAQIAGLFDERQELRRLVIDAQTAERISAGRRGRAARWAGRAAPGGCAAGCAGR